MNWKQLLSTKRLGMEGQPKSYDDRTEFQRDYDRLIFSAPFRRLQNKTQVFPLPGSVFVHNRLTHSLEVASVGMSLGQDVVRRLCALHPELRGTLFEEVGTIVSYATFDRTRNSQDLAWTGQFLYLTGGETVDPTGQTMNANGAPPFYLIALNSSASVIVYHLIIGHQHQDYNYYGKDGATGGTGINVDNPNGLTTGQLEELKTREPDDKPWRARILLVGSEVDDIDFIKLVEDSGAFVCADRFCYGSLPGRDPIVLNDEEDALTQLCSAYMYRGECPRYMDTATMDGRRAYVDELAKEYKADGVIYQQMKFCDPWAYEKMMGSHILRNRYNWPVLAVDRPYTIGSSGQMRTRVQAFLESIDIKKIQKEGE